MNVDFLKCQIYFLPYRRAVLVCKLMDKIILILSLALYVLKKTWISDDKPYKLKFKLVFLFSYTTILQLTLKILMFYYSCYS